MADPFAQLGISRRPANVLFGTPDVSAGALGGWSDAAVQSAAEDQAAQEEYQAAQDARAAADDARAEAARARQSEAAADDYINAEPSSREKFLTPALVGSKRFGEIAQYQQMQPSHADKTLRNQIALRIEHPDDQKIFHEAVDAGEGTWVAKQKADENRRNREFDSSLAAVGVHPKVSEGIRLKEGNSDAVREFHVSKNKMENERIEHPDDQKIFHEAVDAGEGTWAAKQKADENRRNREFDSQLAAVGVHPTEARRIRTEEGNSQAILNHHIYKNRAENERGKDPEANRLRELYKNASEMATHSAKMDPTGLGQADPELVKRMRQHGDALEAYLTAKAPKPAVPAARVGTGTVLRPAEGAAPTTVVPIKPPVAGSPAGATRVPAPGATTEAPATEDENFYTKTIADPNVPLANKKALLEKFKGFVKNPPFQPGSTFGEANQRKEKLKQDLATAESNVELHPVREEYSKAWQNEKNNVDRDIESFAKSNGVNKDQVINSLAKDEKVILPGSMPNEYGEYPHVSVRRLFMDHVAEQEGAKGVDVYDKAAPSLLPFAKHPKAKELGVYHWFGTPVSNFVNSMGGSTRNEVLGVPSRNDVLNQYLKDTMSASSPAAPLPATWKPGQSVAAPGGGTITRTK